MSRSRLARRCPAAAVRSAARVGFLLVLGLLVTGCSDDRAAVSCTAFPNQRAAQQAANTSDGDGDGRYCERLPCPCLQPDGSSTPPRGSRPAARASREGRHTPAAGTSLMLRGRIDEVIDGDTIDVLLTSGRRQRVRLIGIDAPESTTLRTGRVQCGGEAAKRAGRALAGRWPQVTLQSDPAQDTYDRYGRLLAYVVPEGERSTTFQEQLLMAGWANVYVFDRRPFTRVAAFRAAADEARQNRAGVWARCDGDFRRPL